MEWLERNKAFFFHNFTWWWAVEIVSKLIKYLKRYLADWWYRGMILDTENAGILIKLYFQPMENVKSRLFLLFSGGMIHTGNNVNAVWCTL